MQKNNHKPKPVRKSFSDLVNSANAGTNEGFKRVLDAHCRDIGRFITNNQYLLSLEGKSVYRQLKEVSTQTGIIFSKVTYSNLKTGRKVTCSITLLLTIADYWRLDLTQMVKEPEEFKQMVSGIRSQVA